MAARRGASLDKILNPTYRSEMLYRVVDNMAFGSQTIVNDFPLPSDGSDKGTGSAGNGNRSRALPGKC